MPRGLVPMLAKLSRLPEDDAAWAYEIKWDGVRALCYWNGERLALESRNRLDLTAQYPELWGLAGTLGPRTCVLDGEIVALLPDGRPSFQRLQGRMGRAGASLTPRLLAEIPAVYMIFDLLYLDGALLLDRPYVERRERLDALRLDGPSWRVPAYHVNEGRAFLAESRARGLEGIVAKRLDSRYEPGQRSGAWRKIKNTRRQELVIGGYTTGEGAREGRIGALLVGYHDPGMAPAADGRRPLRYAGHVGTGFTEATLRTLAALLDPLATDQNPFDRPVPGARFVVPQLVANVELTEWTRDGTLRHPSFKGLRMDKDAGEVVREREEEG